VGTPGTWEVIERFPAHKAEILILVNPFSDGYIRYKLTIAELGGPTTAAPLYMRFVNPTTYGGDNTHSYFVGGSSTEDGTENKAYQSATDRFNVTGVNLGNDIKIPQSITINMAWQPTGIVTDWSGTVLDYDSNLYTIAGGGTCAAVDVTDIIFETASGCQFSGIFILEGLVA